MNKKHKLTVSQFIAFGYLVVILIGGFLLCTPFASKEFKWTNPLVALFTSTSATCVTGLVAVDTGTYWSIFGQIIILLLIQIGGIGFMAVISLVAIVLKRKINLHERKIIMQSSGSIGIGGVISLLKRIIGATFFCELTGAILLSTQFIPRFGWGKGIYFSIFHSVSAFCNAGFDLIGNYSSFTSFSSNVVVNLTLMLLIISGGLGFLVWSDIFSNRGKWKKIQLHSKIVIVASLILIFIPAILFYLFEYNNAFKDMVWYEKILAALFQSVTCRTAGFNTVDLTTLSDSSMLLSIILMVIGGSPGSTAGGMKTTTFVVLVLSVLCAARKKPNIVVGKRQLEHNITKQACGIAVFYVTMVLFSSIAIMAIESHGAWVSGENPQLFKYVLFETASAIGTVGLTAGGTPALMAGSKVIIMLLMYMGRIGALCIIFIFSERALSDDELLQRPTEKILIG